MNESVLGRFTLGRSGLAQKQVPAGTGYFPLRGAIFGPAGDFTFSVDSLRQVSFSGSFTAAVWLAGAIKLDAVVFSPRAGSSTIDAVFVPASFTLDAFIPTRVEVYRRAGLEHTHQWVEMPNPAWTHAPQAEAKAIVVVLSAYNDIASAVTYGGKALTVRRQTHIYSRYTEVWTLSDLSGRTDDVIRVSGVPTNCFASSTVLSYPGAITYAALSAVSGWTGWVTGNYITTLNDTITPESMKMLFSIAGGEGGDPADSADPYGDGIWLSSGDTASNNAVALVLTTKGPDTGSITGGFTVPNPPGVSGLRYHWSMLMQAEGIAPAPTVDATVLATLDGGFSVGAWFRHDTYAMFSTTVDAVQGEAFESSFGVDAHFPEHFHTDAVILRPLTTGMRLSSTASSGTVSYGLTWQHPHAAGDRCLIVILTRYTSAALLDTISVTYGGLPMTPILASAAIADGTQVWYLNDFEGRFGDTVYVHNNQNYVGRSLMLASGNTVSVEGTAYSPPLNRNGQRLSHTIARAGYSSAFLLSVATSRQVSSSPANWAAAFTPDADLTSYGVMSPGLNSVFSGVLYKDLGLSVGAVGDGYAVKTTQLTWLDTALFTSPPSDGDTFAVSASIEETKTGSRTVNAVVRATPQASTTLDAFLAHHSELDAVITASPSSSFDASAWLREESTAWATFTLDALIPAMGSFLADASLSGRIFVDAHILAFVLVDDRNDTFSIQAPAFGKNIVVLGLAAGFTTDSTDPNYAGIPTRSSGWMRLDVAAGGIYFIDTYGSPNLDTRISIWGPRSTPPGATDPPWHYSDDAYSWLDWDTGGYWSAFSDSSVGAPLGTLFSGGTSGADAGAGLTIEPGSYWICVTPYSTGVANGDFTVNISNGVIIESFAARAFIVDGSVRLFSDEAVDAVAITAPLPGEDFSIIGDFSSLTANANDPYPLANVSAGNATGWIKLEVTKRARFRIDTGGSYYDTPYLTYLPETEMTLWSSSPVYGDEPLHYAGSNYASSGDERYLSAFLDSAPSYPYGTSYPLGSTGARPPTAGITLAAGTYWICVRAEYFLDAVQLNIENLGSPTFFDVDAVIDGSHFKVDATFDPMGFDTGWVQQATVVGKLAHRQPTMSYVGLSGYNAGYTANFQNVWRSIIAPLAGDLLLAFVSGDEENIQRDIYAPGWTKVAYIAPSNHIHAGWVFSRVATAYEPQYWTFYWPVGFVSSMAVEVVIFRNASLGMVRPLAGDGAYLPNNSRHYTDSMVARAGTRALAFWFGNSYSNATSWPTYTVHEGSTSSPISTSRTYYAQAVGRVDAFSADTIARYYAVPASYPSVAINVVVGLEPTPVTGFTLDAHIGFYVSAIIGKTTTRTFTANAIPFLPTISGDFSVDYEWHHGFDTQAIVLAPIPAAGTLDAVRLAVGYGLGSGTIDAAYAIRRLFLARAWLAGTQSSSLPVDAVINNLSMMLDAYVVDPYWGMTWLSAVVKKTILSSLKVDAHVAPVIQPWKIFRLDALVVGDMGEVTVTRSFKADAVIYQQSGTVIFSGEDAWPIDAVVDSFWSETTFTISASITEPYRFGSFLASADVARVGEKRGAFTADAIRGQSPWDLFMLNAVVTQGAFRAYACLAGAISLDATLGLDVYDGSLTADAVLWMEQVTATTADAVLSDAQGDYRGIHADALLIGPQGGSWTLWGLLAGGTTTSFSTDAFLSGSLSVDAFIQPRFMVGAYIDTGELIVYPPSLEGEDGALVDGVFTDPTADFDPSLVGSLIVIGGQTYVILEVIDGQTLVLGIPDTSGPWSIPSADTSGSGGVVVGGVFMDPEADFDASLVGSLIIIEGQTYIIVAVIDGQTLELGIPDASGFWYVPSGSATDAYGGEPPVTRANRVRILWALPFTDDWHDLTPDVLWSNARFTQSARVGAGTFEFALEGAHAFTGGEEIRVEVDGFVVFGGYTMDVDRGYLFSDYATPRTILRGTDYNIVLDKLVVYNAAWDEQQGGSGLYRNWKPFDRGTSDRDIITTIARRFMAPMPGFDFTTYVDEIESPAPTTKWTMQAGTTLRDVLTEISRITEGVWWVDPYRNLHYHDRHEATAPFPITDGDGGISCRELSISSDLSVVVNDTIAWGTEAYEDGDSSIIYSHRVADKDWDVLYWQDKVDRTKDRIAAIQSVPYAQRTLKQRTTLAALKRALVVYQSKLAKARDWATEGSLQRFGRWQHAEFREDIHKQWALDRRTLAILGRYGEPVQKASAIIFDHGFQAGQVAIVSSVTHGVADDMPISQMTIDFAIMKEPIGESYRAVPRYALSLGLDPEEPWDIYQFLPFPDFDFELEPGIHVNGPGGWWFEIGEQPSGSGVLDDFTRVYQDEDDFGIATSDRLEVRIWEAEP